MPGAVGDALWNDLLAGTSYVRPLGCDLVAAWQLDRDRPPQPWHSATPGEPTTVRRIASDQLAVAAMQMVQTQSGLPPADPDRFGLSIGGSKGMLGLPAEAYEQATFPDLIAPTTPLGHIARFTPSSRMSCSVAACATGLVSLIQAARWIRWNECDAAIAGSADASLNPAVLASYRRLGVLSAGQPSPFGRDRDGFVISEGAALLALEEEQHAAARGTEPLAIWAGEDLRSDGSGLVQTDASGEAVAVTVGNALEAAGVPPRAIDAICLHGTGTRQNDRSEGRGLRRVFGDRLRSIPAVSVKGAWGHALGAAGSLETAVCVQMLRDQVVPPHLMHGPVDPACEVAGFAPVAREMPLRHVLKVSLGFGGHIAAAVLSRA